MNTNIWVFVFLSRSNNYQNLTNVQLTFTPLQSPASPLCISVRVELHKGFVRLRHDVLRSSPASWLPGCKTGPVAVVDLNVVVLSFSVEFCEANLDGFALSNVDCLGRVMEVGIILWVIGWRQNPKLWQSPLALTLNSFWKSISVNWRGRKALLYLPQVSLQPPDS